MRRGRAAHRRVLPLIADQTLCRHTPLESLIDAAFERRAEITPATVQPELLEALDQVIDELNPGTLRVAEKVDGGGSRTSGSRRPCCCTSARTTTR